MARWTQGRLAGVVLAVGVAALVTGVFVTRLFKLSTNPEPELIAMLAGTQKEGFTEPIPGAATELVSENHHFDRITVQLSADGASAVATATLDFNGHLGGTHVGSLGIERVHFKQDHGSWRIDGPVAPVLGAAVRALEARRQALGRKDLQALAALQLDVQGKIPLAQERGLAEVMALENPQLDAKAWYIRTERDSVLVTEEYRLQGQLPDRPVDVLGKRRLQLLPAAGSSGGREFSFWPGVM